MKNLSDVVFDIINYWAGFCDLEEEGYSDSQREIIASYMLDLDAVACDDEGLTVEQSEEFDRLVEQCAHEVLSVN